jgi:hypothetical protein
MRHRTWIFALSVLAISLLTGFVWQGDSTAIHDKIGIFGPVLDKLWPVVVTFLTSLVVKGIALANQGFAKADAYVKWIALYFFAMLFNLGARFLGITELDPLAPVFGLGLVQTGAAALVYRFGQHRVPAVASAR